MQLARTMILIATLAVSAPSSAQVLNYQFTGVITGDSADRAILQGDTFTGSWSVEINQTGEAFSTPENDVREYELGTLQLNLNGETLAVEGGFVFVAEAPMPPGTEESHPSGFSSSYIAGRAFPSLSRWGTEVWRIRVVFDYDGLGIWNALALPAAFDFLNNPVAAVLLVDTFGSGFGSSDEIRGRIESVVATAVPLPSSIYFLGVAATLLFRRTKYGDHHKHRAS